MTTAEALAISLLCLVSAFALADDPRPMPQSRRGVLVIDGRQYRYNPPSQGKTAEVAVPGRGVFVVDAAGAVVTNLPPKPRPEPTPEQLARREAIRKRRMEQAAKRSKVGVPQPSPHR